MMSVNRNTFRDSLYFCFQSAMSAEEQANFVNLSESKKDRMFKLWVQAKCIPVHDGNDSSSSVQAFSEQTNETNFDAFNQTLQESAARELEELLNQPPLITNARLPFENHQPPRLQSATCAAGLYFNNAQRQAVGKEIPSLTKDEFKQLRSEVCKLKQAFSRADFEKVWSSNNNLRAYVTTGVGKTLAGAREKCSLTARLNILANAFRQGVNIHIVSDIYLNSDLNAPMPSRTISSTDLANYFLEIASKDNMKQLIGFISGIKDLTFLISLDKRLVWCKKENNDKFEEMQQLRWAVIGRITHLNSLNNNDRIQASTNVISQL